MEKEKGNPQAAGAKTEKSLRATVMGDRGGVER